MTAFDLAVPKPVKLVEFGVDFQIDRAEVEFIGWAEGEETWGLGYQILPGDFSVMPSPGRPWAFDQLEAVLTRTFIREDGARLQAVCGGFDTGYSGVQRALYHYLRPRFVRRYFALKGASRPSWPPWYWTQGKRNERIRLYLTATNRLKQLLYRRATITVPGPGYMHIPATDDYGTEWFKQFLAEDSHTERDKGVEMQIFHMPDTVPEDGTDRNEALDIRVAATAALYIRGPVNWDMEEKRNLATIPPPEGAKKEEPKKRKERGNWLDWKSR
jgi:phage terminase large subunit GpA-like protein